MQSEFVIDDDVHAVAEFMQRSIPAMKLVAVASRVSAVAPLLWGEYQPESVRALRLVSLPISGCDQRKQSVSSGFPPG